jgi:hypothetical protein
MQVCFLPKRSELSESSLKKLSIKSIFFSKRKLISTFKNKMIKLMNYGNNKIGLNNIKLWKLSYYSNIDEIKKIISEKLIDGKKYKEKGYKIETDSLIYLDCKLNLFTIYFIYIRH